MLRILRRWARQARRVRILTRLVDPIGRLGYQWPVGEGSGLY